MLGSTLERRHELVKTMDLFYVDLFYGLRSDVSHAGEEVTGDEIWGLKNLALSLLAKMSVMSSRFETKEAFRAWLVDQRLSPSHDSSNAS